MKKYFVDYETITFLRKLRFNEPELNEGSLFKYNGNYIMGKGIMWQQVKEWLFNKHQIYITSVGIDLSKTTETTGGWYCELHQLGGIKRETYLFDGIKVCGYFNSPTIAEIEGIRKTIELLYSQTAVAVTPINTNANGA